jgi:hypothetical protein
MEKTPEYTYITIHFKKFFDEIFQLIQNQENRNIQVVKNIIEEKIRIYNLASIDDSLSQGIFATLSLLNTWSLEEQQDIDLYLNKFLMNLMMSSHTLFWSDQNTVTWFLDKIVHDLLKVGKKASIDFWWTWQSISHWWASLADIQTLRGKQTLQLLWIDESKALLWNETEIESLSWWNVVILDQVTWEQNFLETLHTKRDILLIAYVVYMRDFLIQGLVKNKKVAAKNPLLRLLRLQW